MIDWAIELSRNMDIGKLPRDCPARAAERMRRDYFETGTISTRDMVIVLGDPAGRVEVSDEYVRRKLAGKG